MTDKVVCILQDFDFEVVKYLGPDRISIIQSAIALCKSKGLSGRSLENRVRAFLNRACKQKMEQSAVWQVPWRDIVDGSRLCAQVDGVLVEGMVSLSPRKIVVHLLYPFAGVDASAIIVASAPKVYTEGDGKGRRASEYGKIKARSLLLELYYDRFVSVK